MAHTTTQMQPAQFERFITTVPASGTVHRTEDLVEVFATPRAGGSRIRVIHARKGLGGVWSVTAPEGLIKTV